MISIHHQKGVTAAKNGKNRVSGITRSMFNNTQDYLAALREFYAGYDTTTENGKNPALTRKFSQRRPSRCYSATVNNKKG